MRTVMFRTMGLSFALSAVILFGGIQGALAQVEVFVDNFDGGPQPEWSGVTTTEDVQDYDTVPTFPAFGGDFLRNTNDTTPQQAPSILTLTGLPSHSAINIKFLLGIIDSWDGIGGSPGGGNDTLNVEVDGTVVFSEIFAIQSGSQTYVGTELSSGSNLGFSSFNDKAYDMRVEPALQNIPHAASSVVIQIYASGNGWQGGADESWAIEDFHVEVVPQVSEPIVGGEILGIDSVALIVSGVGANAGWLITIAGISAAGISGYIIARRR